MAPSARNVFQSFWDNADLALRQKSGSGILPGTAVTNMSEFIVALVVVSLSLAFSFHPLAGLGRAHLQRAVHFSTARPVD
jgi:hypothetical protein